MSELLSVNKLLIMLKLLLRRLPAFVISLAVITVAGFFLTRISPRESVRQQLGVASSSQPNDAFYAERFEKLYKKLGYDKQVFYLSWSSLAVPDSFYHIPDRKQSEQLVDLSGVTGNPESTYAFYNHLQQFRRSCARDTNTSIIDMSAYLYRAEEPDQIVALLNNVVWKKSSLNADAAQLRIELSGLLKESKPWKHWTPSWHFTFDNQFQLWLFGDGDWLTGNGAQFCRGAIRGDFGKSYRTHAYVWDEMKAPFSLTVKISTFALLACFIFTIPLAIFLVKYKTTRLVRFLQPAMIFMYAIPLFWMGTILLMTFANPDMLKWFPASGISPQGGYPVNSNFFDRFLISLPYLFLPIVCYVYEAIIFLSRMLQASLLQQLEMDYVQTARAKGATENAVMYKHVLRNSILPLVTISIAALPAMISGSLLIENIFSLPGMGTGLVQAVRQEDHPMMIGYFLLTGTITILAFMFSDVLYSWIDPRIRLENKEVRND